MGSLVMAPLLLNGCQTTASAGRRAGLELAAVASAVPSARWCYPGAVGGRGFRPSLEYARPFLVWAACRRAARAALVPRHSAVAIGGTLAGWGRSTARRPRGAGVLQTYMGVVA